MNFENISVNKSEVPDENRKKVNSDTETNYSRRNFLKKMAVVGAGLAITPNETVKVFGETLTGNNENNENIKPVIDINFERVDAKVSLTKEDIEKLSSKFEMIAKRDLENQTNSFESESSEKEQQFILMFLKDKITKCILESINRGFSLNPRDTFHAHIGISKDAFMQILQDESFNDMDSVNRDHESDYYNHFSSIDNPELLGQKIIETAIVNQDKYADLIEKNSIILAHGGEWPTKEQLSDETFWRRMEKRNILINENGEVSECYQDYSITKPKESIGKMSKIGPNSRFPDLGVGIENYNKIYNKNYIDLSNLLLAIKFKVDEEGGVFLDENLPKISFSL
jgi:hypothetical protein